MINFLKAVLKTRREIIDNKRFDRSIKEIRKHLKREQCAVITRTELFSYNLKTWSEIQEKLSRVRLVKMDNFDDFIKRIDDLDKSKKVE